MFTLIANHHDPTNTQILDAGGRPVYHIHTTHPETTVTRGDGTVVGTLNFLMIGTNTMGLAGQAQLPESTFLQHVGTWGRAFRAPDGRDYKWHNHDRTLQLTFINKAESGDLLTFYPKRYHVFQDNDPGRFVINDALLPMLDMVILTWVAIERRRQRDERSRRNRGVAAANAGAMSAGAASGGAC